MASVAVSNSAADRAGDHWRHFNKVFQTDDLAKGMHEPERRKEFDKLIQDTMDALATISAYRELHARPMASVTMGIRSMVETARGEDTIRPGQRFKQLKRITGKLIRYPKMRLSQMEDIGGCRVILPSTKQVYDVLHRIHHNWGEDARVSDYIANPKPDGYRGIHVIYKRAGRYVEVQLRTTGQHEWAEAIEAFGPRTGYNLKDGEGPADLREYFEKAAERIARQEAGMSPDPAAERAFATLRKQVTPYFTGNA